MVTRRVSIGTLQIPLALVPYTQANLDRVAAIRGFGERFWPYWLEEWVVTYALAEVLDRSSDVALQGPVLDLGCGSGFFALFLRLRFGIEAFSCDFNFDACRLAAYNANSTISSPSPTRCESAKVFCCDFSAFPSHVQFGSVFAGEMLYSKANHSTILTFLKRHLAPCGKAYLADLGRMAASGFDLVAQAEGFQVEVERSHSHLQNRQIQIFKLSLQSK